MSSFDFDLDDVKLNFIASKLGLSKKGVKNIYAEYNSKIDGLMKNQYLAHSIRALEEFVYVERNNKRVHVMLQALPLPIPCYLEHKTCFLIYYPDTFTPKQIRMCIAHELGHLFFNTRDRAGVYDEDDRKTLEAVANVFGLLLIFGRNKLYSEKSKKLDVFVGKSWENITEEYAEFCGKIDRQRTDDAEEERIE